MSQFVFSKLLVVLNYSNIFIFDVKVLVACLFIYLKQSLILTIGIPY